MFPPPLNWAADINNNNSAAGYSFCKKAAEDVKEVCLGDYVLMPGQVNGGGQIDTTTQDTVEKCKELCDDDKSCNSYEYSMNYNRCERNYRPIPNHDGHWYDMIWNGSVVALAAIVIHGILVRVAALVIIAEFLALLHCVLCGCVYLAATIHLTGHQYIITQAHFFNILSGLFAERIACRRVVVVDVRGPIQWRWEHQDSGQRAHHRCLRRSLQ
jgi:hypothetical protein